MEFLRFKSITRATLPNVEKRLLGELPVPDLSNLDVYHEIGLDLDVANIELLSDCAYHGLYHQILNE